MELVNENDDQFSGMSETVFQALMTEKNMVPCIPPTDYTGSQAEWMTTLQSEGIWDGNPDNWYGEIWIDAETYGEILEKCEGG